jgi:PAS domain S-box-containing protein
LGIPKQSAISRSVRARIDVACVTASVVCIVLSLLALAGWIWHIPALKKLPGQVTVVAPNTALCFILCCAAILLLRQKSPSTLRKIGGKVLAGAVLVFAGLTLAEYVFNVDFGIDGVFLHSRLSDWPVQTPVGRFAVQSAIGFFSFGAALVFLDEKIGRVWLRDLFTAITVLSPVVAMMGYLFAATPFHGVMSAATVVLFCIASVALILTRPDNGISALLVSSGTGGIAARQLIVASTIVLTSIGWIYVRFRELGYVQHGYSVALLTTTSVVAVTCLILWTAYKLDHLDRERESVTRALFKSLHEKQATEDRLNEGLETANAGIWDMNLQTGDIYWSRCHYTLLGYAPNEVQPTVENWRKRVHPEDLQRVEDLWNQSFNNKTRFACQYRVVWPDGTVRWMDTQGKFMSDIDGSPVRSIGGFVDITDRKRSEQALMEAEKLAVTGRMAATLAHEINNPLAGVTNLIFLLKSQNLEGAAQEFLRMADDEIRRVAQIVQKTLSFYRADVQATTTRIADLVDEVIWLYQKRLTDAGIEVSKRYHFSGDIVCNAGEMRQVLTNLFVNAIDAVEKRGKLTVKIAQSRDWMNGGARGVRVLIADSGSGIPESQRSHLFTPFFSLKGDRGTGLGLWISKGIMDKNGGYIRYHSRTQQPTGTVFAIFIPDKTGEAYRPQSVATSA